MSRCPRCQQLIPEHRAPTYCPTCGNAVGLTMAVDGCEDSACGGLSPIVWVAIFVGIAMALFD